MSNATEKAMIRLLKKERFYGNFLLNAKRIYNCNRVATCGVSVTDQINLYINESYFDALSFEEQEDVLRHEAMHVMNMHPLRAKMLGIENLQDSYIHNIATDAVINEPLKSLHKDGVTINKLRKDIKDLEHGKSSEYYYYKLKQKQKELQNEKCPKCGKSKNESRNGDDDNDNGDSKENKECQTCKNGIFGGTTDDHSIWKESTDCEELAKEIVKGTIKKAVEQSGGIGNCPYEVSILLDKLCKNSVNWKQELRRFKAKVANVIYQHTRKKRNRRYGTMFPGKTKKPKIKLAIGVDESGSISGEEWEQFHGEIFAMHKSENIQMTIITCDTEVGNVFDFDPKKKIKRGKMGGTSYQPVLDKAAELEVDGLVFFNDAGNFDKIKKPKYPVLWATVGDEAMLKGKCNFGKEVKVEIVKNDNT